MLLFLVFLQKEKKNKVGESPFSLQLALNKWTTFQETQNGSNHSFSRLSHSTTTPQLTGLWIHNSLFHSLSMSFTPVLRPVSREQDLKLKTICQFCGIEWKKKQFKPFAKLKINKYIHMKQNHNWLKVWRRIWVILKQCSTLSYQFPFTITYKSKVIITFLLSKNIC